MSGSTTKNLPAGKKRLFAPRKNLADWMGALGTESIGVDLGTSRVVIYSRRKGIILPEASMVAMREKDGTMLAFGNRAEAMEGRTPKGIVTIRPLQESAIVEYNPAAYLLQSVLRRTALREVFFHPRLIMCVPPDINGVQRRALLEAAVAMGTKKAVLVEQPLAAAMGAGLDTERMVGAMIVDVGGGSVKISILSRHGIVVSDWLKEGGLSMDQAVMTYVQDKYRVRIGRKAAEEAKIALGITGATSKALHAAEVAGSSVVTALPMKLEVTGDDVRDALQPIMDQICRRVLAVLQRTPPALLADIRDHGILLTGGASQLRGFDDLISKVTGMPAFVAENPSYINAIGAGSALEYMDLFRDSLQDLH